MVVIFRCVAYMVGKGEAVVVIFRCVNCIHGWQGRGGRPCPSTGRSSHFFASSEQNAPSCLAADSSYP